MLTQGLGRSHLHVFSSSQFKKSNRGFATHFLVSLMISLLRHSCFTNPIDEWVFSFEDMFLQNVESTDGNTLLSSFVKHYIFRSARFTFWFQIISGYVTDGNTVESCHQKIHPPMCKIDGLIPNYQWLCHGWKHIAESFIKRYILRCARTTFCF